MSTEIARTAPGPLPAQNLDASVRFASLLADADLLPKQFVGKPANVLYAIEYGRTLGISPVAAITGIHVIEGKPSASSGLIGGLVRQAGHKLRVKSDGMASATAQIIRYDDPEFTYEATWTLERAAQAGLCQIKDHKPFARDRHGKATAWEKYPAAMLKARAITEVARDACEDVLFGLHCTPEELGAVIDQDGNPIDAPVQQLRSVPQTQAEPQTAAEPHDYLHEAHGAADANTVRRIYREAAQDGATPEYLQQIAEVGQRKAAADQPTTPPSSAASLDVEPAPDEHADAVFDLLACAKDLGFDNIQRDAADALGAPLNEAPADKIRGLIAQLRGAA